MRRFMRKAEGLAVAALALIGAGQVVVWIFLSTPSARRATQDLIKF